MLAPLLRALPFLALFPVLVGAAAPVAPPGKLAATLTLREAFGVAHPDQIVDFDLSDPVDPKATRAYDATGGEVPCQVLEGGRKLALRTALSPGAQLQWQVRTGLASAPLPAGTGVTVTERAALLEITSDRAGLRVPRPGRLLAPDGKTLLAPIQGIRLRDGTWTGNGPNALTLGGALKAAEVRFVERGPLKVIIEVAYTVDRKELRYGQTVVAPAGPGRYTCRLEVQAGQPSILIEEETDTQHQYQLVLRELKANQLRYRGHHANRREHGYEADGRTYRPSHERPNLDAYLDLRFDRDLPTSYRTDFGQWPGLRRLAVWDPWVYDSGWYSMAYAKDGPPAANLLGLFAGRASRALGTGNSGVGWHVLSAKSGGPALGLTVQTNQRSPDGTLYPRIRFAWGLFAGRQGEDLLPPEQVQPIARQMNLHGGIHLNKLHRLALDFPDPPAGYGALYMDGAALQRLIARLRQDTQGKHGKGFYGYLYGAETSARELVDLWADKSGQQIQVAAQKLDAMARDLLQAFVHEDGIYTFRWHYWHGGLEMSRKLMWIDQILSSDAATPAQKARAKAIAVLFAAVLWDDDFVPMFRGHSLNLGTPNMPVQQNNYRAMYALYLAQHPMMKERVASVWESARRELAATINEHGAHMGSVHYVGAAQGPLLSTCQQLQHAGVADAFRTEERLAKFAEFYMNMLTPPEPRFGNRRKLVAIGDGSTEGSELFGQMATGFAKVNPDLSARLMGAWNENGKVHSGFHGTTLLKIDEGLPVKPLQLGSATIPGWCSVLRSGGGTPDETAVWFVNGTWYRDHYHEDQGSVVIYALGAPLSVDWGSVYAPRVAGGYAHSGVLPEAALKFPWDQDSPPPDAGAGCRDAQPEQFVTNPGAAKAAARFRRSGLEWRRTVSLRHADPAQPLILIEDTFTGSDADKPKVFTLNLMAEGVVRTPGGEVTPVARLYNNADRKELPSAGKPFALPAGVSRLAFTGQTWKAHPAGGIDCDVYVLAGAAQQGLIGNWGHTWHPGNEAAAFRQANGRPFEERQHILRLRGTGPFRVLLAPRRKGARPAELKMELAGEAVRITVGGKEVSIP